MTPIERMTWRLHNITRMVEARIAYETFIDWARAIAFFGLGLLILVIAENVK